MGFLFSPSMYYFYIIYSIKIDKYYIGHTSDLGERLRRHNSNHKGFTGSADDWEIVYSENYSTKSEAYSREREVKKLKRRDLLLKLISSGGSEHPD